MSASHTKMSVDSYKAMEREILNLQNRQDPGMLSAIREAEDALSQMKNRSSSLLSALSEQRRQNIANIENASHAMLQGIAQAKQDVPVLEQQMQGLNESIRQASNEVNNMLSRAKKALHSGTELYQEVTRQLTVSLTIPDYQKFAGEQLSNLQERLNNLGSHALAPDAMQAMAVNALNDIYLMDIVVAKKRSEFESRYIQATKLAETIMTHIRSVKANNYEDLEAQTGELLDMTYWTDGRFRIVEDEVTQIQQRIRQSRDDEAYQLENLQKDLSRLQELDKIETRLVAEGRETYNHSMNRMAQGQMCCDILADDHGYEVICEGFDGSDRREAYVARLRRHTTGAEIEVIVNQGTGAQRDEYDVYFRIDAKTYMDERTMQTLTEDIAKEFQAYGVSMNLFKHCSVETMEPVTAKGVRVSDEARRRHNISKRQIPTTA